jgi:hypothetical protein
MDIGLDIISEKVASCRVAREKRGNASRVKDEKEWA